MNTRRQPWGRSDESHWAQWWWTTDRWVLGVVALLVVGGAVLQFGTSPDAASRYELSSPYYYAVRQCVFAGVGLMVLVGVSSLRARAIRRLAFVLFLVSLAAMAALPLIGHNAKGGTRWVQIGSFALQPSEFLKPALLVLVAWMFSLAQKREAPGVPIAFAMYGAAVLLLMIQPDLGQTVLLTAAFCTAFWVAGMPLLWILIMGGLAAGGLAAAVVLMPHAHTRMTGFLNADHDGPTQLHAAAKAIAHGGLLGRGAGEGLLKAKIPDMHTDFAYSAAAEDHGLVLSLILIALFGFLVIRGLYRSMKLTTTYEQVGSAALFTVLGMQAFINISVNLGLIPTKGMTLPFISYGGSSLIASCLTAGMALALTRDPDSRAQDSGPFRNLAFA